MAKEKTLLEQLQEAAAYGKRVEFLYPLNENDPDSLYAKRCVIFFRFPVSRAGDQLAKGWDFNWDKGKSKRRSGFRCFHIAKMVEPRVLEDENKQDGDLRDVLQKKWRYVLKVEKAIRGHVLSEGPVLFPAGTKNKFQVWSAQPTVSNNESFEEGSWAAMPQIEPVQQEVYYSRQQ